MGADECETGKTNIEEKGRDDSIKEAVLKVYVHCEGCSNKVVNCLKGFHGVEDVVIDAGNHIVIVKGQNVDPIRVLGRLQSKFSKNVELISPLLSPHDDNYHTAVPQRKEEARVETLILRMYMHCERCAHDITRNIERMRGIMFAEAYIERSTVVIKGIFDTENLVSIITRRLGKHVEIVKQESEEEPKGNDNKSKHEEVVKQITSHEEPKERDEDIANEQQILVPYYAAYVFILH